MAAKKVGELIKEARTNAGLSQEALAKLIEGVSATDIGKAERGEKELTQAALKAIAKATGVTQKSLLEAPKGGAAAAKKPAAKTAAAKTPAAKTEAAKKPAAKTEAAKKPAASAKKTTTAAKKTTNAVELTAAEKTLVNAYRKADAETRKAALALLKGEKGDDMISGLLAGLLGNLGIK